MSGELPKHLFSVDVEEYFQVSAFERVVPRERWRALPSRVALGTALLLDLLARHGTSGTFFVLGWVAERHPELVRRIAAAGHEIASHGYWHRRVCTLTPGEFREDVRRARAVLEDVTGEEITGFRAPSFSITPGTEWALDVLLEEGHVYDSSLFPIHRPGYGHPAAPRSPGWIDCGSGRIFEFPLATARVLGARIPAAGGGYLRQFPYAVTRTAFRQHEAAGLPAVFYAHPWEVDAAQPRLDVGALTRLRHYRGLDVMLPRIERLLREFRFEPMRAALARRSERLGASSAAAPGRALRLVS